MISNLVADFRIIFERDPAARNWLEVLLCYPGLQALFLHRFAHLLYRLGLPLVPRFLSHISRFLTGIEIHPGAQIGKGVCIDHGMGIVIGETAIIGDYCLVYQGVTLGGTGKETGKRHPTLGQNVVVGAGAKVLGNLQIGNNVRIGAGSVVLRDVPSDCTVVGVPGRIVYRSGERVEPLEHGRLPDSEAQVIRFLVDRIESLEQEVQDLRSKVDTSTVTLPEHMSLVAVSHASSEEHASMEHTSIEHASINALVEGSMVDESAMEGSTEADKVSDPSRCRLRNRVIEEFLDGSGI